MGLTAGLMTFDNQEAKLSFETGQKLKSGCSLYGGSNLDPPTLVFGAGGGWDPGRQMYLKQCYSKCGLNPLGSEPVV